MDCFYVFASLSDRLEFACGKTMFLHRVSYCSRGEGGGRWGVVWGRFSVPACTTGHMAGGLCPGGSSVWGALCLEKGVSVQGGSLSGRVSVRETPHTVTSRRYASYWNTFLFPLRSHNPCCLLRYHGGSQFRSTKSV